MPWIHWQGHHRRPAPPEIFDEMLPDTGSAERPAVHACCSVATETAASVAASTTGNVARARMGAGLAVAVLLLPLGGYGLARTGAVPESTPLYLGLLSGLLGFGLLTSLGEERAPFRHTSSRLTAHTLTGERSVDLNRIATVRLLTTLSYGRTYRTLVVRDVNGVRLGVTTDTAREGGQSQRAEEHADEGRQRGRARPDPLGGKAVGAGGGLLGKACAEAGAPTSPARGRAARYHVRSPQQPSASTAAARSDREPRLSGEDTRQRPPFDPACNGSANYVIPVPWRRSRRREALRETADFHGMFTTHGNSTGGTEFF
ncbi:hypothetical protein OIE69_35860 [Actinacidiphila glaucinigra]|uniref:hypothetical protein n=1 Tax=Actinacidiphila glaucinigra TaxID=235986 RepID=UPI002DD85992|nr:hypothetical protein [Actinacidiphila glaucinigra]WSD63888.1 hypothetical protein OIE69_35860 [Actinacidiphila glaucinigra]